MEAAWPKLYALVDATIVFLVYYSITHSSQSPHNHRFERCTATSVVTTLNENYKLTQLGQLKHGFLLLRRVLRKCCSLKGENIPLKEWTIFVWKDLRTTSLSFFWSLLSSDESEELLPELLSESESESELLPLEEDCWWITWPVWAGYVWVM